MNYAISGFLSKTGRSALFLPLAATLLAAQTQTVANTFEDDRVVELDAIRVEAIRDGMERSILEQRAANNVVNVVAADSIGRFPDLNLADSLSRVSGLSIERDQGEARTVNVRGAPASYTSVAIDGITMPSPSSGSREMRLDTIPTDVVGTLEVMKAITPDIDADNIGGHVNIRTQGAFDRSGRSIRTNVGLGYNELGGGIVKNIGLTYSDRLLEDRNLGVLFSFSDYETDRHTANIENNQWRIVPGSTDVFRPTRPDTRTYELVRSRSSYSGRVDFKPNDNTYLYVSTLFSDWSDDEKRDNYRLPFSSFSEGSSFPTGTVSNVAVDSNHNIREVVNTIRAHKFGGEQQFGESTLDYSITLGSASNVTEKPNTYFSFRVKSDARPDVAYDFNDSELPSIVRVGDDRTLLSAPEDMEFLRYEQREGGTEDDDLTIALNYEKPAELFGRDSTLKFGFKLKEKEKVREEARTRWNSGDVPFAVSFTDLIGSELATNFGLYPWGFKTERGSAAELGQRIRESGPGSDNASVRHGNFYEVSEEIYAAYGMATTRLENLTVVAGLRVEHTKNTGVANQTTDGWDTFTRETASNDYTNFFPSLHFVRKLSDNQSLKLSFSTAIARASFSTLRPSEVINEENLTISAGNPDIDPTRSFGIDLYYDYYIQPLGIFTAGVFAKKIDDPIFSGSRFVRRNGQDYTLSQALNGSDGKLHGFEINFERPFTFLPAPFDGFGMFANYTYTNSEAELPPNPDGSSRGNVSLEGSSEQSYNFALYYEREGFNARLSYVYRSEWLDSFNLDTPELTRFWDERPQLDFTASIPLNSSTSLYINANNLTDERGRRYLGNRTRIYELEGFGSSYMVGAKMNF